MKMNFDYSPRVQELQKKLRSFMVEHIYPRERDYYEQVATGDRWKVLPILGPLKAKAQAAGLWNLFLPETEYGAGLSNLEYAPLCELRGRSVMAPEVFNCSPPDAGNMETLVRYG